MISRLLDDVRHGARILTKSPGLSLTAALLVALVVGGNATIYSMVNSQIRRPAPGVTAEDLVSFGLVGRPGAPYFSYADYSHYAAQTTSLRSLAAWGFGREGVSTPTGTFLRQISPVTRNFFDTTGILPARGRAFAADDDRGGAPLVAIISDGVWQTYFARAEDILGRRIDLGGRAATIVGVTPPRFGGVSSGEWTDVWVPFHAYRRVEPATTVAMIGRLATGASVERARADFATLQARLASPSPDIRRAPVLVTRYAASAGGVLPAFQREVLAIFSIITLLTVFVVGANLANLMLARAVVRQRETAVRQSLGASRGRLTRLVIVEGGAIAAVAAILGFVFAWWAAWFVPTILPQGRATMPMDFTPDWRVAVYAALLALLGTIGSSLVAARRTWKQDPLPALKDGAHTTAGGQSAVSSALVVLQLAFSVLLLTAGILAYRSGSILITDVGFDQRNMLLVNVGTAGAAQSAADTLRLLERVRERLAAMPNVVSVSYTGPASTPNPVRVDASGDPLAATVESIGPDYLETLGLAPIAGRTMSRAEVFSTSSTAMISSSLAATAFPGSNPVGRTLLIGEQKSPVTIVAVTPNISAGRANETSNRVFLAHRPAVRGDDRFERPTTLWVRYNERLDRVSAAVPGALRDVDPRIAIAGQETLEAQLADEALGARMISRLLMTFASISLLIAAVGQYAVVAFNMRRRTRDFGVRIALGASAGQITGAVLSEGTRLTAAGLALGCVLSVAVATVLRGVLFGVTPTDPPTYLAVFALLGCVSLLACYLPARRASRINPVQALRQD
jgi:putative ABC transport system permease protein